MKLIEIQLVLSNLTNSNQTVECRKKLCDFEFDFRVQTRCISSFFARLLGEFKTRDCKKILLKFVPEIRGNELVTFPGGFCDYQILYNHEHFWTLSDLEKKKETLELLMIGVRRIANSKKWDLQPFEDVYKKIVEADYKNEWIWGKPIKSPDNQKTAHIFLQHDVHQIDFFMIVCDKEGHELIKEKILSEKPDEWAYAQHLGALKWYGNSNVALINRNGDAKWSIEF